MLDCPRDGRNKQAGPRWREQGFTTHQRSATTDGDKSNGTQMQATTRKGVFSGGQDLIRTAG